jgi:hypothetical protein
VIPILALTILVIITRLLPLATQALRLRYNSRWQTLAVFRPQLPPHTTVELDVHCGDGQRVRLRLDSNQGGKPDVRA